MSWFKPSTQSPELDQDWRNINWGEREHIEAELRNFELSNPQINHLRMMLLGQVGSGKSSFINAASSVFEHRVITKADVAYGLTFSTTKQYRVYKIKNGKSGHLPFIFNDIMGLQDETVTRGIQYDDFVNALNGHIRDDYKFNPQFSLKPGDVFYNKYPSLDDKIHCVVNVMPAPTVSLMDQKIIDTIRSVNEKARDLGISNVVILTKIDECCPLVQKDIRKVYKSKKIRQKMQECSSILGIPLNSVFPVKNYNEEYEPNNNTDVLILSALKRIVTIANDFVEDLAWRTSAYASEDNPAWNVEAEREEMLARNLERCNLSMPEPPPYSKLRTYTKPAISTDATLLSNPTQPPVPELDKEWRIITWGERDELENNLREFEVNNSEVEELRILVQGPVGAGKSSFINSTCSAFAHRIMTRALVSQNQTSQTKRYKSYRIKDGKCGNLKFIFCDLMGLEGADSTGIHHDDIKSALQGHIKKDHVFNPLTSVKNGDPNYNSSPTLNDKVHCLVSIMPGASVSHIPDTVIRKMKLVRETASDLDIPQVVVMTKIDECCPLIQENLRNVYISRKIKQAMTECSNLLGIPMNCIFPVKNYFEETNTNNDMDVLILSAVQQIVNFANDYIEDL